MKNTSILMLLSLILLAGFKSDHPKQQEGLIPDSQVLHIGIVVKDVEKTLDQWVKLLGLTERPRVFEVAGHEGNPTQYRGKPSKARALLSFMDLKNMQVELIQPIGEAPSHWYEFLETKGEGVHHMAFLVDGMGEFHIENFEKNGYPLAQHGGWEQGEYGYLDGLQQLGVMVELIERYDD